MIRESNFNALNLKNLDEKIMPESGHRTYGNWLVHPWRKAVLKRSSLPTVLIPFQFSLKSPSK